VPRSVQTIYYSAAFEKKYRRLPDEIKRTAEKKESLFRRDTFAPTLRTHKLKGPLAGSWAFSIGYDLRIVFRFLADDSVIFLSIGSHDAVY